MRLEPAPLGLLEREGERVEQLMRAEPDVPAFAALDLGPEDVGVLATRIAAVETVAGDDQVARRRTRVSSADLGFEDQT